MRARSDLERALARAAGSPHEAIVSLTPSTLIDDVSTDGEWPEPRVARCEGHADLWAAYRGASGLIEVCAGCRLALRRRGGEAWEPLPEAPHGRPAGVTHGMCEACIDRLYGAALGL